MDIVGIPAFPFWLVTAGTATAAGFGLIAGFRALHRARLIEDAPTGKVRSAPQGYVELAGSAFAMTGEPIIAPLSHVHCCWYRFSVEERDERNWTTLQRGASDDLFLIRDATGECVVDPDGAEITPAHREVWYGDEPYGGAFGVHQRSQTTPGIVEKIAVAGIRIGAAPLAMASKYRFVEEVILDEDPLYIIGNFRTLDDIDHTQNRRELTAQILREWKQRAQTLQARFDHNRDGIIDSAEWEHARQVAELKAAEEYAAQADGQHVHMFNCPRDASLPYLISNVPEFDLVRRYRWLAFWRLALFFGAGIAVTWMFAARFFQ